MRSKAFLLALGVVVACSAAAAVPAARAPRTAPLPRSCLHKATEPAVAACLRPYFRRAAAEGRVHGTLAALELAVGRGDLDDCHALAHAFAHAVFDRIRDTVRALALGGTQCSDGYQHGVLEAAAAAGPHVSRTDPRACARRPTEELRDACFHALGHAYMYETGHDVTRSLRRCRAGLGPHARPRCEGGVLMENSMQYMRLGAALYRLHAPRACDGLRLRRPLRFTCYAEIGEVAMFVFRHRLSSVRPVCSRVPTRFGRRACLEGAREELELVRSARG